MAEIIEIKSELDWTGSNGGRDVKCVVFTSEPSAEQQAECLAQGYGMQWANGKTHALTDDRNFERENELSLSLENIFWFVVGGFCLAFVLATAMAFVQLFGGV